MSHWLQSFARLPSETNHAARATARGGSKLLLDNQAQIIYLALDGTGRVLAAF